MKPYHFKHMRGSSLTAAIGPWQVEGPGIETLYFEERETAAVVARALNMAFLEGKKFPAT